MTGETTQSRISRLESIVMDQQKCIDGLMEAVKCNTASVVALNRIIMSRQRKELEPKKGFIDRIIAHMGK